ncbi:MAG: hypothetical protein GY765_37760, partial [bacterium]|nr:hypothetical protein [bacterium]
MSLSIFIAGYMGSMVYGLFSGHRIQLRLENITEHMFPISVESQLALFAFNDQVKLYKDAVITDEIEILENARNKSM